MAKIEESGFKISMSKETQLSKEMAEQLYAGNRDSEYFDDLTSMMSRYGQIHTVGSHMSKHYLLAIKIVTAACIETY